jgi:hypothetical protein
MFLENNNNNNPIDDPISTNGYKWLEVGWWCRLIPSSLKLWVQICQGTTKHAPSPKKNPQVKQMLIMEDTNRTTPYLLTKKYLVCPLRKWIPSPLNFLSYR